MRHCFVHAKTEPSHGVGRLFVPDKVVSRKESWKKDESSEPLNIQTRCGFEYDF